MISIFIGPDSAEIWTDVEGDKKSGRCIASCENLDNALDEAIAAVAKELQDLKKLREEFKKWRHLSSALTHFRHGKL